MTKLDSPVTRITALIVDGREVDITLNPGVPESLVPESLEIHLKGLKSSKRVPLPVILNALGYKVEGFKKPAEVRDAFTRLLAGERVSPEEFERDIVALEAALAPFKGQ
jgi:hypothetical protein